MTSEQLDHERQLFHEAMRNIGHLGPLIYNVDLNCYTDDCADTAWCVWQEAREAEQPQKEVTHE